MLDHVSYAVSNIEKSREFYDKTLAALGVERMMNFDFEEYSVSGYGANNKPFFWISEEKVPNDKDFVGKGKGFHLAFRAASSEEVDKWYAMCLELGAKDNGAPGPRPIYHPGYYGAFVIDPDGYRIEACFHEYKE